MRVRVPSGKKKGLGLLEKDPENAGFTRIGIPSWSLVTLLNHQIFILPVIVDLHPDLVPRSYFSCTGPVVWTEVSNSLLPFYDGPFDYVVLKDSPNLYSVLVTFQPLVLVSFPPLVLVPYLPLVPIPMSYPVLLNEVV